MIKNLLLSALWLFALVGANSFAADAEGFVFLPGGKAAPDVSVFVLINNGAKLKSQIIPHQVLHTDSNGKYRYSLPVLNNGDSLVFIVLDCHGQAYSSSMSYRQMPGTMNVFHLDTMRPTCAPAACQNLIFKKMVNGGRHLLLKAIPLIDTQTTRFNSANPNPTWSFSDGSTATGFEVFKNVFNIGNNSGSISFCFSTSSLCSLNYCDSLNIFNDPTLLNCHARWEVDTLNSQRFHGNVVIWNQSTSQGHSTNFLWSFGDGHYSTERFPTHHYQDTGVYDLCLAVVALTGNDTCASLHCGRVGLNHKGELIFKHKSNGFTIQVVNPRSIGLLEDRLASWSVYPNPSRGFFQVEGPDREALQKLSLYNLQGQLIATKNFSVDAESRRWELENITVGTYIVKIESATGVYTQRVLIKD